MSLLYVSLLMDEHLCIPSGLVPPRRGVSAQTTQQPKPRAIPREPEPSDEEVYEDPVADDATAEPDSVSDVESGSDDDEFYMNVAQAAPLRTVDHDYDEPPPRPPRRVDDDAPAPPHKRDFGAKKKDGLDVRAKNPAGSHDRNPNFKARASPEKPNNSGVTSKIVASKPKFAPKPINAKTLPAKPSAVTKQVVRQRAGERATEDVERKTATMPNRFGKTMLAKRINQFNQ